MKGGLRELALRSPVLALAIEQALSKKGLQRLVAQALDVILRIGLQDVLDVLGLAD
jgi:hypothetical protein